MATIRELVETIAERHALPWEPVVSLAGGGSVNHVFSVGSGSERHVVRIPIDELRPDEFEVEQWCLERARDAGIPVPEAVARGEVEGRPYLVLTHVDGSAPAADDTHAAWEALGRYGRLVHEIDPDSGPDGLFTRFGRDPAEAWRRHLAYNADLLDESDPLIRMGVYASADRPRLVELIEELESCDIEQGLRHGDLAPRNLLVRPDGVPVLLDWGQASVGPVPYGDLLPAYTSHLVDGRPTAGDLSAFATALGHALDEVRPVLNRLRVLEAMDLVRWAIDRRPDRVAELAHAARAALQIGTKD